MFLYRHGFRFLTLFALALLCRSAVGQTSLFGDTRLDRKTTVEAEGIALADLLALLSAKTGVSLKAHNSMADKKVILFFRQQPLRDLMTGLATLFDAGWQTVPGTDSATAGYEITLGLKAQNRERDLLRETIRRLSSQVDTYIRALSLSPDELNALPPDNPLREFLSAPNQRRGIELYSLLNASQRETLWSKRRVTFPFASLNDRQQQVVAAIFQDETARLQAIADRVKDNPNVKITVPRMQQLLKGSVQFRLRRLGGPLTLMLQMPGFSIQLARTDDTGLWLLPPHGDPYHPRHPTPAPPLPNPEAVTASRNAANELPGRLRALADRASFNIFADYYRSRPIVRTRPREADRTAAEAVSDAVLAMDALCGDSGYLWWSREKSLFLRKRDWYLQQIMEPPDPWIRRMARKVGSESERSSEELVSTLALLSVEQIAGLNSIFTPLADESLLDGLPELLSVITSLTAPQRRLIQEGAPVTLEMQAAPPRLRRAAIAFLAAHFPPDASDRPASLTVQLPPLIPVRRDNAAAHSRLEILWQSGDLSGVYRVYLPHSLPGESPERLRVE